MFFKKKCPSCGTKNPKDATTCASCGAAFELRQAESREAIKDYHEAIRLNPQSAEAYYKRGFVYQNLGQGERAIEDFDEAIRLNPNDAYAYLLRGAAYGTIGDTDEAIADLEKAIADLEKAIAITDNPELAEQARQLIEEVSE